jgi:DNA/RNA endonuclease YhcR with UshA esterase domain
MKTKNKIFQILILILIGFFILPKIAFAANTDIIITEIAAFESDGYEWIELHNKGTEPIDLTGWTFYENETNHKLNEFQNDLIIESQEYAIIADVGEKFLEANPEFTGTIIDSSWTSLKESGEKIAIVDSNQETIESFTYLSCPSTSLQRINNGLNDYSENNWQEHPDNHSAGTINQFETLPDQDDIPDEPIPDNPNPVQVDIGTILINEFVSDPVSGQNEWIELYNTNSFEVDLTDWIIMDGSSAETILQGQILANSFYVIDSPKGKLNNSGDIIVLNDSQGQQIDKVAYGDWLGNENNSPAASDPYSTARKIDGQNSNNNFNDFTITETLTKNTPNIITQNQELEEDSITYKFPVLPDPLEVKYKGNIIITEIYPNPPGSDLEYEFIELKNIGKQTIDVAGLKIQDYDKKTYKISKNDFKNTKIKPDKYFTIHRLISGIALSNDKDTVRLIDLKDKTIQTVKYKEDKNLTQGASYSFFEDEWTWTTNTTANFDNKITPLNHPPEIEIDCPKEILVNQIFTCDASDSFDYEDDKLKFIWQINNTIFETVRFQYQFTQKGTYQIDLNINDAQFEVNDSHKIKVIEDKNSTATGGIKVKTATIKNNDTFTEITLEDIRLLEKNTKVKTRGIVSVLPNTFGKTIMYVAGSGIQLYMYKADWPNLLIGDLIEFTGTLTESKGESRIKISTKDDIKIIDQNWEPHLNKIQINQINESLEGYLVEFAGQLIEKSSSTLFFKDETGETQVYIKQNTKIKKGELNEGEEYKITGIVSQKNDVYQILPRSNDDIVKIQNIIKEEEPIVLPQNTKNISILKYLISGASFLIMGLAATFYQSKKRKKKSPDDNIRGSS